MKHVSILIPQGHFSMVNVEGTHQIFSWVNSYLQQEGKSPYFQLQLVGISPSTTQTNGLFTINAEALVHEVKKTDLIVIPAIHGDLSANLEANGAFIPWVIQQYKGGAEVVSLCIASFFLASTGLLDGKRCATHWQFAQDFRAKFPQTKLVDDRILTESDGIYTSGGAYSFTNLLIYLIEKYLGRRLAILAAKSFMIDIDRDSQSPFMLFVGQRTHKDAAVLKAQDYIEQHYTDKLTVEMLSDSVGVGRRSFERRFKKATCNTIIEYIQRVKMEAAKKQLEFGRKTVNEVMYEVGYTDTKAFRDIFKKYSSMTPSDYRKKYYVKLQN